MTLLERVKHCERGLSLTQPWGWAMLWAGKDTENRKPGFSHKSFRGDFFIHAAQGAATKQYRRWAAELIHKKTAGESGFAAGTLAPGCNWTCSVVDAQIKARALPVAATKLYRGGIIGIARITDIVPPGESGRLWHFPEEYGFVVEDVQPLPFIDCRGKLGFWRVDSVTKMNVALAVNSSRMYEVK